MLPVIFSDIFTGSALHGLAVVAPGFSLAEGGGWGTGLGFGFWDRLGRVFGGTGGGDRVGMGSGGYGGIWGGYGGGYGYGYGEDMGGIWEGGLGPGFGLSELRMVSLITHLSAPALTARAFRSRRLKHAPISDLKGYICIYTHTICEVTLSPKVLGHQLCPHNLNKC